MQFLYLRVFFFLTTFYFDSLHLYSNISTFYSSRENNLLVTFEETCQHFFVIHSSCLKWSYLNLAVV